MKSIVIAAVVSLLIVAVGACSTVREEPQSNSIDRNSANVVPAHTDGAQNINAANPFPPPTANSNVSNSSNELKTSIYAARPGPDNSTFTSAMDKSGNFMEVREFKNHPMIVKVERRMLKDGSKYIVYLKNGKAAEAPADKMENFRSMAPGNILAAIGINVAPTSTDVQDERKSKKPE